MFGDIFERDNLDWHSRKVATVCMLSAMTGVESQLLAERVDVESARRALEALERHLARAKG